MLPIILWTLGATLVAGAVAILTMSESCTPQKRRKVALQCALAAGGGLVGTWFIVYLLT